MRNKLTLVTPLLAAGAAAVAIVTAPAATAVPKTCVGNGPGMTCRSNADVETTNLAPDVSVTPHWTMPYLLGAR
jgi:hypothetical protein